MAATAQNTHNKAYALITGASGGIGLEIAHSLAERKNNLILVARNKFELEKISTELKAKHKIDVRVMSMDLSKEEAPRELFEQIQQEALSVEILVNNAGFGVFGPFLETDMAREREMIQLNIIALYTLTKLFLPQMLTQKSGRILNVASTAAFQPGPLMAVYFASKAFVLHLSEALAEELSSTHVTVSSLCPGATETSFQIEAKMEGSKLFKSGVMDARSVAEAGVIGMLRGERVIVPGLRNKVLANTVRFAPRGLVTKIVKKIQEKSPAT